MNILVIGKKGRLEKLSSPDVLKRHSVSHLDINASPSDIIAKGRMADILLVDAIYRLPKDVITCLPRLRMIHSEGVGYQGIDTETARRMGIPVCNCRGINALPVAEHTLMLMTACLRGLIVNHEAVFRGQQIEIKEGYMREGSLRELADCRVGLIGFGCIAKETARLLSAYHAECVFWNRSEVDPSECFNARQVSLEELLASSDIISLHVPVTPDTQNMADAAFFGKCRQGSILINTARGELVETEALISAMREGRIAMAGLDCLAGEPIHAEHPLLLAGDDIASRLILSPHIVGVTGSSLRRAYDIFWRNVAHIENKECPDNIVNGFFV